ncbi:MAG: carboxypeptidase regulatory-like domain-containing protein [Acidobacteria bacterium]|nr:carboxypeptidase regulatory-like domain-containing protein [Acidobacteriota bacterium]
MKHRKFYLSLIFAAAIAFVSCGEKETTAPTETAEPGAPAAPPTPIDQATVATLTGKVSFEGAKPRLSRLMMDQDPVCVQKHSGPVLAEDGAVNDNGTLPNAFVYVKSGAEKYTFAVPSTPAELDQDGCVYRPHVLGVQVGQTLQIMTKDPTTHNIHPMPKNNREWNISQAPNAAPLEQKFSREEIMIPVKCNQHPWMKAYIGVTKNPFFAVTSSDGTFTIKGLPPGDYTIEAWTATFGTQEQKVTVGAKESKTMDFKFKSS